MHNSAGHALGREDSVGSSADRMREGAGIGMRLDATTLVAVLALSEEGSTLPFQAFEIEGSISGFTARASPELDLAFGKEGLADSSGTKGGTR